MHVVGFVHVRKCTCVVTPYFSLHVSECIARDDDGRTRKQGTTGGASQWFGVCCCRHADVYLGRRLTTDNEGLVHVLFLNFQIFKVLCV